MAQAVLNLRRIILGSEHYRHEVSAAIGLGETESQALSYLAVHGESGQSELARDLNLTSSAATALVDRLERQGVAGRVQHPVDRRRFLIRLTARGEGMLRESEGWLMATLSLFSPDDLERVSETLATIARDLSTRSSADPSEGGLDMPSAPPC